jgi:hypothetical protein
VTEAQTIDAAERALMAETLRGLAGELDGTELVHALDAFGFADLLAEAPRDAVSALFTALGRAGSMSSSLQDVLLQPLAEYLPAPRTECNVLLPGIGADLVGATDGEALTVRGLVIGARTARRIWRRSRFRVSWPGLASRDSRGFPRGGSKVSIRRWR